MKSLAIRLITAFLSLLYGIFGVFGTKNRIVCISRQSDSDPVDFALIKRYLTEHNPEIKTVILAKAIHSPVSYAPHMIKQTYFIATSKAIVLDSYCIVVSLLGDRITSPVIQMWHALGNMKKFGYATLDEPEGRSSETAQLLKMHKGYDSVLISSKSFENDYAAGFGIDTSVITELPLPRVDLLIDPRVKEREKELIYFRYPQLAQKRNIVYCPTFRREAAANESIAMESLLSAIDFDKYNFIFSPHPVSKQVIEDDRVITDRDSSLNMLYIADFVISDYSTVIYEAGLLDVPIYLYAYDWSTYSQKRSLNIDIERDVPTIFTDDPLEIVNAIEHNEFDHDAYRKFLLNNIALPAEGTCTQHVVEHILSLAKQ